MEPSVALCSPFSNNSLLVQDDMGFEIISFDQCDPRKLTKVIHALRHIWDKDGIEYGKYFGGGTYDQQNLRWKKLIDQLLCLEFVAPDTDHEAQLQLVIRIVGLWWASVFSQLNKTPYSWTPSVTVNDYGMNRDCSRLANSIAKVHEELDVLGRDKRPTDEELNSVFDHLRDIRLQKIEYRFFVVSPDEVKVERTGFKEPVVRLLSLEPVKPGQPSDFWDVDATLSMLTYFYTNRTKNPFLARNLSRFLDPLGPLLFGAGTVPMTFELTQTNPRYRLFYVLAVSLFCLAMHTWQAPCARDGSCHLDQSLLDRDNPSGKKAVQEAVYYKALAEAQRQPPPTAVSLVSSNQQNFNWSSHP